MAKGKHRKRFRRKVKVVKDERNLAYERIQYLVNFIDLNVPGEMPDHTFTFPDGETWIADSAKPQFAR
jgi:hypothetical protein